MASGPESIVSPANPNRRHAINSDALAKDKRPPLRKRRRAAYVESVTQRAKNNAKLTNPPPDSTSKNMEWAVPRAGLNSGP